MAVWDRILGWRSDTDNNQRSGSNLSDDISRKIPDTYYVQGSRGRCEPKYTMFTEEYCRKQYKQITEIQQ